MDNDLKGFIYFKCDECGCKTYKILPDPRDRKQEIMVCEDCEYAITEKYSQEIHDPNQPQDYGSKTHGF